MRLLILPNDKIQTDDSDDESTVIASVVLSDHDPDNIVQVLLVLNHYPMYYSVIEVGTGTGHVHVLGDYSNIVPAVESYQENGGDY